MENLFTNHCLKINFSKIKPEAYEKLIKMSRNNDYTTGNLLDYLYHQKYYRVIGVDISRQTNTSIPQ